jgi:hypothetical protein
MTDPPYDDERALRAVLGTLLADEPPTSSTVSDDVARGRAHRARRRARAGGGVALVAVVALVVGLVGPLRVLDRSTPAPLGSASPSPTLTGTQVAVADYLASIGWPLSSTRVSVRPDDGAILATTYAVHSAADPGMTALLSVQSFDSPPSRDLVLPAVSGSRFGSALQRCGDACTRVSVTTPDCVSGSMTCDPAEASAWVARPTTGFEVGALIVERTWPDGTQLEAIVSTRHCSTCATSTPLPADQLVGATTSFLPRADRVLDLVGKPTLRDRPTTGSASFEADPAPNPYYVVRDVDPSWAKDALAALTTYTTGRGALVVGEDDRTARLDVLRGGQRAWLQLASATTTSDAPECLGLPNCTVLQPWTAGRGGAMQVAVTETTVPASTVSTAMRGPSYQVLVRAGHNLLRLDEGTTFPTLFDGQRPGYVLTWQQVAAAADRLRVPGATPVPSGSPS